MRAPCTFYLPPANAAICRAALHCDGPAARALRAWIEADLRPMLDGTGTLPATLDAPLRHRFAAALRELNEGPRRIRRVHSHGPKSYAPNLHSLDWIADTILTRFVGEPIEESERSRFAPSGPE